MVELHTALKRISLGEDHIERGNIIDMSCLKFRVIDEADKMLRMGFVDEVELILGKVQNVTKVQTLLFSATFPSWVKQISKKILQANQKYIHLVAAEIRKIEASTNVRHIVLPCNSTNHRAQLIPDIIPCYSRGGRTIIFTEEKLSANVIAGLLPDARALHGEDQFQIYDQLYFLLHLGCILEVSPRQNA
ncbi:unnamed protein product [Trifolium pratense]|uniref:Uncharacterized protein n=1 Tax=Trifolium pratense TaxID=57577 RepID=A0ACB0IZG9_TRIPR|nr:unnamed protein product [Trifolium pratense]